VSTSRHQAAMRAIATLHRELAEAYESGEESQLYFIRSGSDGPIKIGRALSAEHRRTELQSGNPLKLTVLAAFPGGKRVERAAHHAFEWLHVRGEWFAPDPFLLDFIDGLRILEAVA
jgi:hypothetical protein